MKKLTFLILVIVTLAISCCQPTDQAETQGSPTDGQEANLETEEAVVPIETQSPTRTPAPSDTPTPTLEWLVVEFAEQVRIGAESGSADYLANPVYLHPIGCLGHCDEPPVSSLSGFVPPLDAVEYISNCLASLEETSERQFMSNYGFNPTPIYTDELDPQRPVSGTEFFFDPERPVSGTEFFFEWGMDEGSDNRAFARLFLGVRQLDLGYQVMEAYCYPFIQ